MNPLDEIINKGVNAEIKGTKEFVTVEFNNVKLYITANHERVNVTKLWKTFKKYGNFDQPRIKASFTSWINGAGAGLKDCYPDKFVNVYGKGTQEYKGVYVHHSLFLPILYSIDVTKATLWLNGENWINVGNEGYLYVAQPKAQLGTNIYKIGATKDMKTRLNVLGKGTIVYGTVRVSEKYIGEIYLKDGFNEHFEKCSEIGNEYYKIDNVEDLHDVFLDIDFGDLNLEEQNIYDESENKFEIQ